MNPNTYIPLGDTELKSGNEEDNGPFKDAMVQRVDQLTFRSLLELFNGNCRAITIDDYCPPDIAEMIANQIEHHPRVGGYVVDRNILRFGESFYDTAKDPCLIETYFVEAVPTMRDLRLACSPYASPVDQLKLELNEAWPSGSVIAMLSDRKTMAGTARIFHNGVGALPHVDILGFDAQDFPDAPVLKTQASANVILRVAGGGELALWDRRILTSEEEAACRLPTSSYGLDENKIGPPVITLKPQPGQLILFDSTRCHSVRPSAGGTRVTMSMFIGYEGAEQPLVMWS